MASLISAMASTALESLASSALQEVASAWHFESNLLKLTNTIRTIKDVLLVADNDEGHQPHVLKNLIERLKDTVYEADDLLDKFTTLVERKRLMTSHGAFKKEVRIFFSNDNQIATAFTISSKMKMIRKALDDIIGDREQFAPMLPSNEQVVESWSVKERETSSFVVDEDIIGRDDDKQKILDVLLRDGHSDPTTHTMVVIPIVGIGGLGKTSVAQLAFNDEEVKNYFDLNLWVCIGYVVGLKVIIRKITMSATESSCPNDMGLEQLHRKLRRKIEGKRYLLVLDDIWEEDPNELLQLRSLLSIGEKGSRVIVTTRSMYTAQGIGTISPLNLQLLSDNTSWVLFAKMAFGTTWEHQQKDEGLVQIGTEIVKKCANLPLAIKVIGSLLRGKDLAEWQYFKDYNLSKIDTTAGIMPLLKLSYYRLPPQLKHCFTYCSLFPKDYEIKKMELCHLWMAHGFVKLSSSTHSKECSEDVAEQCFMALLHRCFFQDIQRNEWGEIKSFKMHDLVHDLAQEVAGKEILFTDNGGDLINLVSGIRHLSIMRASHMPKLPSFLHGGGNQLRSFLQLSHDDFYPDLGQRKVPWEVGNLIRNFQCIKVLDLSALRINQLPDSISRLIHIRYLDLSCNDFELLPKSITKLHNLETLKLFRCLVLKELPRDLSKLVNLQNLDIRLCDCLSYMPLGMGSLTSLRRLTRFVVGEGKMVDTAHGNTYWWNSKRHIVKNASGIDDLILLKNLRGPLEIAIATMRVNCSTSNKSFKAAGCLLDKGHLTELVITMNWANKAVDEERDEELLESLQPHSNLKSFTLRGYYGGLKLPRWMSMNNLSLALPNLVVIALMDCERCQHLPILSQLPYLRTVHLTRLCDLEYIESKCYEASSTSVAFFPSLKRLVMTHLSTVKGWWPPTDFREELSCDQQYDMAQPPLLLPSFPCLSELLIRDCPNMINMPLCPRVEDLSLCKFNERLSIFMETTEEWNSAAPFCSSPSSSSTSSPLSSKAAPILKSLHIDNFEYLNQLPEQCLHNLKGLTITYMYLNVVLSGGFFQHLTELVSLKIEECPELNLTAAHEEEEDGMPWKFLQRLRYLEFYFLPKLKTLPKGLTYLTNLQELRIASCHELLEVPEWISQLSRSLQRLVIRRCTKLESLPIGIRDLTCLRNIDLKHCDGLIERCRKPTGEDWPKIQHIPEITLPDGEKYVSGNLVPE